MDIIMSNAGKLEIFPLVKFIWKQHHHQEFNSMMFIINSKIGVNISCNLFSWEEMSWIHDVPKL